MSETQIMDLIKATGAIWDGHFEVFAGMHSKRLLSDEVLVQFPVVIATLCEELAKRVNAKETGIPIDVVVGGWRSSARAFAFALALELGARYAQPRTELTEDSWTWSLADATAIREGDGALIFEPSLVTLGTVTALASLAVERGAVIAGVAAIVDSRGSGDLRTVGGRRPQALVRVDLKLYGAAACPMCQGGKPPLERRNWL